MTSINLQIHNITQTLVVENNGRDLDFSMPNLEWIYNMTVQNVSSLETPTLSHVNASLSLYGNSISQYESPLLQSIGGTLAVDGNAYLRNITLPSLQNIGGGLWLNDNTNLTLVNQIEALTTVGGNVQINGTIAE